MPSPQLHYALKGWRFPSWARALAVLAFCQDSLGVLHAFPVLLVLLCSLILSRLLCLPSVCFLPSLLRLLVLSALLVLPVLAVWAVLLDPFDLLVSLVWLLPSMLRLHDPFWEWLFSYWVESAAGAWNPFSFGSRASTLLLGSSCSLFSATLTKACFQACSLANLLCLCPFLVHLEASSLAILPLLFFCFLRGTNFNEIFLLYGPLIPSSSVCRSFNSSCPANFDSSFSSSLRLLRLFILPLLFLGFLHFCSFNLFAFSVLFLLDLHCFLACLFSHLGCFLSCFLIFNDGWRMILPKKKVAPKKRKFFWTGFTPTHSKTQSAMEVPQFTSQ